ncbi:MAG: hypothetical protein QM485_03515 [Flavobacteriaceae bacterium]
MKILHPSFKYVFYTFSVLTLICCQEMGQKNSSESSDITQLQKDWVSIGPGGGGHVCYVCGFNSSAYRSEDNGRTRNRIKWCNFKWVERVDIDPRTTENIFISTFGGRHLVWACQGSGVSRGCSNANNGILIKGT